MLMRPATGTPSISSSNSSVSGNTNTNNTPTTNAASQQLPNATDSDFDAASDCAVCDKKFHAFRRKHRCRSCGNAVCGNCARTHKMMPSSMLLRTNNEPVRVCDRCIHGQTQMMQERRRTEDIDRARARQQAALQDERIQRMLEQSRLDQILAQQLDLEERHKASHLRSLEIKHFGTALPDNRPRQPPIPATTIRRRRKSMDDLARLRSMAEAQKQHPLQRVEPQHHKELEEVFIRDAEKRALEILDMAGIKMQPLPLPPPVPVQPTATPMPMLARQPTIVQEADECAICLDTMEVGNAIYTTSCGHSFHWKCLKEIQLSDASNADKCPSCRTVMKEMQVKKLCDHPRVRVGHRFCRDCGSAVSERDAKPRPGEENDGHTPSRQGGGAAPSGGGGGGAGARPPPPPTSYRASSHGALVRCPQCQIQMRVLPHMYNMRVACPSGHMFLVQVAPQTGGAPPQSSVGRGGGRAPPRGSHSGYPGSQYHG